MAPLARCLSSLTALLGFGREGLIPASTGSQSVLAPPRSSSLNDAGITDTVSEFKWGNIIPSKSLKFHNCFDGFQCARLQVPMDWNSTAADPETIAIAIIKYPSKVSVTDPRYAGPLLINPGGPGGSGVSLALREAKPLQTVVDAGYYDGHGDHLVPSKSARYYDILSWDPRGINNTTPYHSCFSKSADQIAWNLQNDASLGTPEGDLNVLWAKAQALAANCLYDEQTNKNGSRIANFTTTAMVVRDMVEIIEQHAAWREKQAKHEIAAVRASSLLSTSEELEILGRTKHNAGKEVLNYWGFSYGTVLGATFAAMQPQRVHRLILDGVSDSEDYYHLGWIRNLQDTDAVMGAFFEYCFIAGKDKCKMFVGDSPADIKTAFDDVETRILVEGPIPVPATSTRGPQIITASDIHLLLFEILYKPYAKFEKLANIMGPLALYNNGSAFADWKAERHAELKKGPACDYIDPYNSTCSPPGFGEASQAILCGEGDEGVFTNITKETFADAWSVMHNQSQYFGDRWAGIRLACANWKGRGKWKFTGPFEAETAHPVLWIGNTLDNVTPLRNAHKMAKGYKDSVVLQADVEGHCSSAYPNLCIGKAVRAYFQEGKLPEKGTVCLPHKRPLLGEKGPRVSPLPEVMSRDEQILLGALERMNNGTSG